MQCAPAGDIFYMNIKPFFSYEQQIEELQRKGIILNHDECLDFLKDVNYYRLSAYLLPYKGKAARLEFNQIKKIYEFDSKLRSLVIPVIENVEIKFRSRLAYLFSEKYGAEGYLDSSNFSSRHNHEAFLSHIAKCITDNRQSVVIKHHEEKYESHYPLWVLIEFFSMGMLSYFYSDMKRSDKKHLVKEIGFPRSDREIESWLRCLTILRNKCAHYSRLYYSVFPSIPMFEEGLDRERERTLYPQLLMLKNLLLDDNLWNEMFSVPFHSLIEEYKEFIEEKHIGLPIDWRDRL